jgi:hypothetical protein
MGVNGKETAKSGKVLRVVENRAAVIAPGTAVSSLEKIKKYLRTVLRVSAIREFSHPMEERVRRVSLEVQ